MVDHRSRRVLLVRIVFASQMDNRHYSVFLILTTLLANSQAWSSQVSSSSLGKVVSPELMQEPGISSFLSTTFYLITLIGVIVLFFALYRVIDRLREYRKAEQMSEAQFEASVLASLNDDAQFVPLVKKDSQPTSEASFPGNPLTPVRHGDEDPRMVSVEISCKRVLDQLRNSGLLEEVESFLPIHGNPKGAAILRFKNKKRVLLVPYYETEYFTEYQLGSYDALLYVSRAGRAVYLQSLENLIADRFAQ